MEHHFYSKECLRDKLWLFTFECLAHVLLKIDKNEPATSSIVEFCKTCIYHYDLDSLSCLKTFLMKSWMLLAIGFSRLI